MYERNLIKEYLKRKSTKYQLVIMSLVMLVFVIHTINTIYWRNVNENVVWYEDTLGNNIKAAVIIFVWSLIGIFLVYNIEKYNKKNIYFATLPIVIMIFKIIQEIGFGEIANAQPHYICTWNYDYISYVSVMLFWSVLILPRAVKELVGMRKNYENIIIVAYTVGIALLCLWFFKGINGAFLSSIIIFFSYFLFVNKKEVKRNLWVILPFVITIFMGALLAIDENYVTKTFDRLSGRESLEQYQYELFINGKYEEELCDGYVTFNNIDGIKESPVGIIGVLIVLILYSMIVFFVYRFIKECVTRKSDKKMAISILSTMSIIWVAIMLDRFGFWDFGFSFVEPFTTDSSFIWLHPILVIFSLGKSERRGLNEW